MIKDFADPRHQPITMREIKEAEAAEERRRQEEAERPIREAEARLTASHRAIYALDKATVIAGNPDIGFFVMPESVKKLRMTIDQAVKFAEAESARFVAENPSYRRSDHNHKVICDYLIANGVEIPTAEAFKIGFERCRYFGLLDEHPADPVPQTVEQLEPTEPPKQDDGLIEGYDPETGLKKFWTKRQVFLMGSDLYKAAFHVRPSLRKRLE
jgi:hypothetical protein